MRTYTLTQVTAILGAGVYTILFYYVSYNVMSADRMVLYYYK